MSLWEKLGQDINGVTGDLSGASVSLSSDGTIVAIGADYNSNNGISAGTCRVYQLGLTGGTTGWIQLGTDIDGKTGDNSGYTVSLSSDGTIVAVGSPSNDDIGTNSGLCRVYQLVITGGVHRWIQLGEDIKGKTGDSSGYSVSLSSNGTIVAIGSPKNNTNGSGACRVYQLGTTDWVQLGHDINGQTGGEAGYSVSLSSDGTIVAVGVPFNSGNSPTYTGAGRCCVYQLGLTGGIGTTGWVKLGENIDGEIGDTLGESLSISGNGKMVALGCAGNSKCRVYQLGLTGGTGTTGWVQLGTTIDGETGTRFGFSVSLSNDGSTLAIGAYLNDTNGTDSGQSYIYKLGLTGGTTGWVQIGQDIDGKTGGSESGYSVSLSDNGSIVAIGALRNNDGGSSAGQTRVYQFTSGTTGSTGTTGSEEIVCYAKGTLILTKQGYLPIETIKSGHEVITKGTIYKQGIKFHEFMQTEPVTWISKFKVTYLNSTSRPICIKKNAFGENPFRDLYVSPNHNICVQGKMVQAKLLINDDTIYQDTECNSIEYYHLECKHHNLIIANGILAESYLDIKNRYVFNNKHHDIYNLKKINAKFT